MQSTQDDDFDPADCIAGMDFEGFNLLPQPVSPIQALVPSVAASIPPITPAAAPSKLLCNGRNDQRTSTLPVATQ